MFGSRGSNSGTEGFSATGSIRQTACGIKEKSRCSTWMQLPQMVRPQQFKRRLWLSGRPFSEKEDAEHKADRRAAQVQQASGVTLLAVMLV